MDCQKGKNAFRKQLSDLRDEMHEKVTALRREHERDDRKRERDGTRSESSKGVSQQ